MFPVSLAIWATIAGQADGALEALVSYDIVVIHAEATDEAAHSGLADERIQTIQRVDNEIVTRLRSWDKEALPAVMLPSRATAIEAQTPVGDPVPFVLWRSGFKASGAKRFAGTAARDTGVIVEEGHSIIRRLIE